MQGKRRKKIVGFGASSMEGVGDDVGGGFFARLASAVGKYRFVNLGIGGNTTRDMLLRRSQVLRHRPYDLVVLLGCNDYPRANDEHAHMRTSLKEYKTNLCQLLLLIRGERSIFVTSYEVDPKRTGVDSGLFKRYTTAARLVAGDCGYEVIDLYSIVKKSRRNYLAADGVHFNAEGHQFIADLVRPALLRPRS
jgi:lysophospholipase L1-like esterase